ncbi:MAG: MBL fold metallo-hydrolase [Holophagales bacterium]|nr:MBL fold metallo-hydrolase [Holophagales bacterium]
MATPKEASMRRSSPSFAPLALALLAVVAARAVPAAEIASGVELVPGRFVPGRQPDGNTVILRGRGGLVVVDTGRHAEHAKKVIEAARATGLPVKAVVNTHWHLDHVGGNPAVKAAYPSVRVYASSAIDGALKGFLATYRAQLLEMIARAPEPEKTKEWRDEVARIDSGRALGPDEVVTSSGQREIAGRRLELHLESRAVTEGDVWIFDSATHVLVAGDLVTLPVPFLDTACPARWEAGLERLSTTDFRLLVPGHGAPMTRPAFETYRTAFDRLLSCASSPQEKEACVEGWMKDAGSLLAGEDAGFVRSLADYYVGSVLRGDEKRLARLCGGS